MPTKRMQTQIKSDTRRSITPSASPSPLAPSASPALPPLMPLRPLPPLSPFGLSPQFQNVGVGHAYGGLQRYYD